MNNFEYTIRNDLAIQNKNLKLIKEVTKDNITMKYYKKDKFDYTNIIFSLLETEEHKNNLKRIIKNELQKFLKKYNIQKGSCLVVGLGNENIISDSLGSRCLDYITATGYLKELKIKNNYRTVYTYKPSVLKETGFMAFNGIKALKKELKPDFIIIIDSLISDNIKYLNKLIQITDIGIIPGSGISNYQEEISIKTLKIPTIVIGIPLAIETSTIIRDIIAPNQEKITYKEGYDFIVSAKDIDIVVKKLGKVLGEAINNALNTFNSDLS